MSGLLSYGSRGNNIVVHAYLNYPEPDIVAHHDPACPDIRKHRKVDQRKARIDLDSASDELRKFANREYKFASRARENDMWLQIDFSDGRFEDAVLCYVHRLLGQYYSPFARITVKNHC